MADALGALFTALTPLWGMSLTAAYAAGIVFLLRLVLKKRAPRQSVCLLWLIVFARLLLPFSLQSPLSAVPQALAEGARPAVSQSGAQENPAPIQENGPAVPQTDAPGDAQGDPQTGDPAQSVGQDGPAAVAPLPGQPQGGDSSITPNQPQQQAAFPWRALAAGVWLAGAAAMLGYALLSWLLLRRRLFDAVRVESGVWEHPSVRSPFLLGWLRPRIYLPCGVGEPARSFILCHERTHLRRGDHIVKPICWAALSLHWFNPAAWLAFLLLSRDMEAACDQGVIRRLGPACKQDYSSALLAVAAGRKFPAPCPLAFGGSGVGERIKTVLTYHRPALWIVLVGSLAVAGAAVCLLTDPIARASGTPVTGGDGGFSVTSLGAPQDGRYTHFRLTRGEDAVEFDGACLAQVSPAVYAADLNGDGAQECVVVFTAREDGLLFTQEAHVFDAATLEEYPCGGLLTAAQSALTYSVSQDSYSISAADGFTQEIGKESLPFPREELLPHLAAGDYYAFSVEGGALSCTIGLRATETDYAGYLTVTLALEGGGFRPAGYAWAPAQGVTEHLLPPLDDSLDIAVPDFLTQEQQELYRNAYNVYYHLFGPDTSMVDYWDESDTHTTITPENMVQSAGPSYYALGRYARWEDFDAMVHALFTDEFFQSCNDSGGLGPTYWEADGALCFTWGFPGSVLGSNEHFPDTFELVERTADRICFTVTGHYSNTLPFPDETQEEARQRLASGYEYTLTFPVTLVRTPAGWRVDQFQCTASDGEYTVGYAPDLLRADNPNGVRSTEIRLLQAGDSLILDWDCGYFELSQPISRDNLTGLYLQDLDGDGADEVAVTYLPNGSAAPVVTVYELAKGALTAHSFDTAQVLDHFAGSSAARYQPETEVLTFTLSGAQPVSGQIYLSRAFFDAGSLAPEDVYCGCAESVSELNLAGGGITAVLRPVLADRREDPAAVTAAPIGRLDYPITYTGSGFTLGAPALTLFSHSQEESADLPALTALAAALRGSSPISMDQPRGEVWLDPSDPAVELDGQRLDITGFTLADLDGDGTREGVLRLALPGGSYETYGFLVLRVLDSGSVSGHAQTYRGLMGLKADGTFSYSSGAFDHGAARLRFLSGDWELEVLAGVESDGSGRVLLYTVGGRTATAEDFEAALARQEAKADAVWYDYTGHNLLNLLP